LYPVEVQAVASAAAVVVLVVTFMSQMPICQRELQL